MLLVPVLGALAAGFAGRANRNTKPAKGTYKTDSTSP